MRPLPLRFGLEGEYLLVDLATWRPLWHSELSFTALNELLESIDSEPLLKGMTLEGLELDPPHRTIMPFYVEGYGIPAAGADASGLSAWVDLAPKGIEIRTPVCDSIDDCLGVYERLYQGLQDALQEAGLRMVALAHHPTAWEFTGPQNHPRHDWWKWGQRAMTTYGPDLNLSLPSAFRAGYDWEHLERRLNYYAPSMVAFSLASPVVKETLWRPHGRVGLSARTWRRSIGCPPVAAHPKEQGRLEFKAFDMPVDRSDFLPYFLLWTWLVLDELAPGQADEADRVYSLGEVARIGWSAVEVAARGEEILDRAEHVLPAFGFDPAPLARLACRLEDRMTPAHGLIGEFRTCRSLETFLQRLDERANDAACAATAGLSPVSSRLQGGLPDELLVRVEDQRFGFFPADAAVGDRDPELQL